MRRCREVIDCALHNDARYKQYYRNKLCRRAVAAHEEDEESDGTIIEENISPTKNLRSTIEQLDLERSFYSDTQ